MNWAITFEKKKKMKFILASFLALILFGCRENQSNATATTANQSLDTVAKPETIQSERSVYYSTTVDRNLKAFIASSIPAGIHLDSIVSLDYSKHASVYFIYPVGPNKRINQTIKTFATQQVNEFSESVYSEIQEEKAITSDLQFVPEAIFQNEKLTSYRFFTSSYMEGTPHPNSEYYSFTFVNQSGKLMSFSDVFQLSGKADTLQLIALINEQIYQPELTPLTTLKDIDFNVMSDGISFNFGPYDIGSYAEGDRQGTVPYAKIRRYLNPIYFSN